MHVLSSSSSSSDKIGTSNTKMIPLPSEDTLRFTTRCNGVRVAEIITETVAMIARSKPFYVNFCVLLPFYVNFVFI
jgi:hypothetical protein